MACPVPEPCLTKPALYAWYGVALFLCLLWAVIVPNVPGMSQFFWTSWPRVVISTLFMLGLYVMVGAMIFANPHRKRFGHEQMLP